MVVDVTDDDLRMTAQWFRRRNLNEDLMTQFFRLKGGKFVMIINSILSVQRWDEVIKPGLVQLFGQDRCRFESMVPARLFEELLGEGGDNDDVEEI